MIEDALSVQWELSYEAGQQLSKLCQTLDVACVECKKPDASFIIDGKIFIRCCKRDRVLILMLSLVPIPSVEKLSTDLSNIDLVVRLQQQVNPRMSSPTKRQREPDAAEMPESSKAKTEYSPLVPKRYTAEEFQVVEEVQGHKNLPLPGFTFTVNPDGNSISLSVEGCPEGQYNQGIRWIGQDWVCYMPRYTCLRFVALLPVIHFIDFGAFQLLACLFIVCSLVSKGIPEEPSKNSTRLPSSIHSRLKRDKRLRTNSWMRYANATSSRPLLQRYYQPSQLYLCQC
jgi:hypothetical protein